MAARLKLCLMCHIEDDTQWQRLNPAVPASDKFAIGIGTLASAVAVYGAKLSLQVGSRYLDQNQGLGYPGGPTSLALVLANGGNFWNHVHAAGYTNLISNWTTVSSAYGSEANPQVGLTVATPMTAGRSAGADVSNPTVDWASITVWAGIKRMNASTVNFYAGTPDSMRPYQMTATDILYGVDFHRGAPGPLYDGAPTTMRQRPFWVNSSSAWDLHLTSTLPTELTIGSLLFIPSPSRSQLGGMSEGRGAYRGDPTSTITVQDMNSALTEVWSTYQQMSTYQQSISNVWYMHIEPGFLTDHNGVVLPVVTTLGVWVQSINALLNVPNSAVWMNMNEIASGYCNTTSAFW